MQFLVTPQQARNSFTGNRHLSLAEVENTSLGGVFYDYLCDSSSKVIGVRYHLMEQVDFAEHPVFRQFLVDPRFAFHPQSHVDMVFNESNAAELQNGLFEVAVVQDFGGESVLMNGGQFSIVFDLPDSVLAEVKTINGAGNGTSPSAA